MPIFDPAAYRDLLVDLASAIRDAVYPLLGKDSSRAISGIANSGDTTFAADIAAENTLDAFIRERAIPAAYYSEDAGLVEVASDPVFTLIVDPIDGTRPAICGFEACVVSIALIPQGLKATLGNVAAGVVLEIPSGKLFYAEKGKGATVQQIGTTNGTSVHSIRPTNREHPAGMFFSFEFAGNPTRDVMRYLAPFIDQSSLAGGAFMMNSSAFGVTRVACGQLDAFLAVGARVLQDNPELESAFRELARDKIVGLFPYDIAAAALVAREVGVKVTDAYGNSLKDVGCLNKGREGFISMVAAATPDLHGRIIDMLNDAAERQ